MFIFDVQCTCRYDTDAKPSEGSGDESKEASLQKVKHSKRKASPAAPKSSKKAKIVSRVCVNGCI